MSILSPEGSHQKVKSISEVSWRRESGMDSRLWSLSCDLDEGASSDGWN